MSSIPATTTASLPSMSSATTTTAASASQPPATMQSPTSFQLKSVVEYAKTNTSICEGCKCKILAETMRVGVVYTNGSTFARDRLSWFHDGCYSKKLVPDIRRVDGFNKLGTEDQLKLVIQQDTHTNPPPAQPPRRRLGGTSAAGAVDQAVSSGQPPTLLMGGTSAAGVVDQAVAKSVLDDLEDEVHIQRVIEREKANLSKRKAEERFEKDLQAMIDADTTKAPSKRKVEEVLGETDSDDDDDDDIEEDSDDLDDPDDPDYEEDAKFIEPATPPSCAFIVPQATEPFVWVCTTWLSYYFERLDKKAWFPSDARKVRQSLTKTVKSKKFRDSRSFALNGDETKGAYTFIMDHLRSQGLVHREMGGLKSITLFRETRTLEYIAKNVDGAVRKPNRRLSSNSIVIPIIPTQTPVVKQPQLPQAPPGVQLSAPVVKQTQLPQASVPNPGVQPPAPLPAPPQAKPKNMVVDHTPVKPNSIKVDVPLGISMVFHQSCCKATRVVVDIDEKTDFKNVFHTMRISSCSNCGDKMCHFCRGDGDNCKECYKFIAELQKRKKRKADSDAKEVQSLSLASAALPVPTTAPVSEEKK